MKKHKHIWSVLEEDTRYDCCQICGKIRLAKNIAWKGTTPIWAKTREVPLWEGCKVSDNGDFVDQLNDKLDVEFTLNTLTPKQQEVCKKVLMGGKQREIADDLDITQSAVSQRFNNAIEKLEND